MSLLIGTESTSEKKGKTTIEKLATVALYSFFIGSIIYFSQSTDVQEWTPSEWNEVKEYRKNVRDNYNKLFENAANVEDSLRIYQKNNLKKYIEFNEPSFEDKERIFKALESGVK